MTVHERHLEDSVPGRVWKRVSAPGRRRPYNGTDTWA